MIICIDAGATKTELIACDGNGKIISAKKYEPVNFTLHGFKRTLHSIESMIRSSVKSHKKEPLTCVVAGIAGARDPKDRKRLSSELKKKLKINKIEVLPDTEIALASCFRPDEKNCGILIAGTGSILYYRDGKGRILRIGGWGRFVGDEGSGYWIAREALNRVSRYYDGRQSKTLLAGKIERKLGIGKNNLLKKIYMEKFDIPIITEFVFECAESNDSASREIISRAAAHLASHFEPVKGRQVKIALYGSLFSKEKLLERNLRRIVKASYPKINLLKPRNRPVEGALKIALKLLKK